MKVRIIVLGIVLLFAVQRTAVCQTGKDGPPYRDGTAGGGVIEMAGAVYAEDLSEEEMERLETLLSNPVKINIASRSRLVETGLFTPYQVAAIIDYRSRNGDILSEAELAALDGFGQETARMLVPFVNFVSYASPGRSSIRRPYVDNTVILKSAMKAQGHEPDGEPSGSQFNYGLKYKFSMNDRIEAGITGRNSYSTVLTPPDAASFYMVYYGRGALGKIIVGDYNARFGQGLVMWSGFSISGVPTQSAFSKRPSGISPYWSYSGSGSHRGVAADFSAGDFTISAFASIPGSRERVLGEDDAEMSFLPGLNVTWSGMNGQAALTCYARSKTISGEAGGNVSASEDGHFFRECLASGDIRFTVRGVELFAETALDVINSNHQLLQMGKTIGKHI